MHSQVAGQITGFRAVPVEGMTVVRVVVVDGSAKQ
jgi:hypothetical protein